MSHEVVTIEEQFDEHGNLTSRVETRRPRTAMEGLNDFIAEQRKQSASFGMQRRWPSGPGFNWHGTLREGGGTSHGRQYVEE